MEPVTVNVYVGGRRCSGGQEARAVASDSLQQGQVILPQQGLQRYDGQPVPVHINEPVDLPVLPRVAGPCLPAIRPGHQPVPACGNPGVTGPRWVAAKVKGKIGIVAEAIGPRKGRGNVDDKLVPGYDGTSAQVVASGLDASS